MKTRSLVAASLLAHLLFSAALARAAEDAGVPGAGGLLIQPKRIVLGARQRAAELNLINHGREATTYRLELEERTMDEQGRLLPISATKGSPAGSIKGLLRFAPRQVTVDPGKQQSIRLMVRKPADLAAGEYRSHLLLRALPPASSGADPMRNGGPEDGISIRLIPVPAISIPVIVRHGEVSGAVELGARFEPRAHAEKRPGLIVDLGRTGNRSFYGDIVAQLEAGGGTGAVVVGRARGLAIYTTIDRRRVQLPLRFPAEWQGALPRDSSDPRLVVTFRSRPEHDGGGEVTVAEAELAWPPATAVPHR